MTAHCTALNCLRKQTKKQTKQEYMVNYIKFMANMYDYELFVL